MSNTIKNDADESETLWSESIYGAETRKGLVKLSFGNIKVIISPSEAREFALSVIACAEAAEMDELIMKWLSDCCGVKDDAQRVQVLRDFRLLRDEMRAPDTDNESGPLTEV